MVLKTFRQYTFPPISGQVQVFMPGIVKNSIFKKIANDNTVFLKYIFYLATSSVLVLLKGYALSF